MKHSEFERNAMRQRLQLRHDKFMERLEARVFPETSLHLVRGYDLRESLAGKALDCNRRTMWTAFVNCKGTLVHVVPREGDLHVRIPLWRSTVGCTDAYMKKLIGGKLFYREVL